MGSLIVMRRLIGVGESSRCLLSLLTYLCILLLVSGADRDTLTIWCGTEDTGNSRLDVARGDPRIWVPAFLSSGALPAHNFISRSPDLTYIKMAALYAEKKLFWWNKAGKNIQSMDPHLYVGDRSTQATKYDVPCSHKVTALAIDWVAKNLYFADLGEQKIMMMQLDAPYGYRTVVTFTDNQEEGDRGPNGVAVHPATSQLFWTNGINETIETSDLAGHDRHVLFNRSYNSPTRFKILGVDKDWLYWVDATRSRLERSTVYGHSRMIVSQSFQGVQGFAMTSSYIFSVNGYGGLAIYDILLQQTSIKSMDRYLHDVVVMSAETQPAIESPCSQSECKELCVGARNNTEAQCLAAVGVSWRPRGYGVVGAAVLAFLICQSTKYQN